jgi:LPXTG-motif cell wall-anchored protein
VANFGFTPVPTFPTLPVTGIDTTSIAIAAIMLLLAGAFLMLATRKRKDDDSLGDSAI